MEPVIDAHHHIWRQADLPWLSGPMVPRIFGPYEPLRRDYSIEEYLQDIGGSGVEKSIYVQTNWPNDRFEDEVTWVQATANRSGWPHAIVGYADFTVPDVRPQLDRLIRYKLVRGVRMQVHWHERPDYRFAQDPQLLRRDVFRRNVEALAAYGLTFDLQLFSSQAKLGAELARDNPKCTFVLVHSGMSADRSPEARAAWRAGLSALAAEANVCAKLSGLGTFIRQNDPVEISTIAGEALALFGSDRCMFGSNFPIEKLWTDFETLLGSYRAALSSLTPTERCNVLWRTAERVYRPV